MQVLLLIWRMMHGSCLHLMSRFRNCIHIMAMIFFPSTAGRPAWKFPWDFVVAKSGTFRIKLDRITDLDSLVLEDLKLNVFHEFNNGDYVFDYEAGEASGRFKLHLNTLGNDEINGNKLQVYALGQSIVINSQDVMTKAELEILDVAGKKLGQYQLPEQQNYQLRTQLPAGIYILKLQTNTNQLTKKIIIKIKKITETYSTRKDALPYASSTTVRLTNCGMSLKNKVK